jgi:beta-lactamase superfamily II metal-dependent hydrolase
VPRVIGGDSFGKLAVVDLGCSDNWRPSTFIESIGRNRIDYLAITNADQDHMTDLEGLSKAGIQVGTFMRNQSYSAQAIQVIKAAQGPLTDEAKRYVAMCTSFNAPTSEPFDANMGGITMTMFGNNYPYFTDTNNLSLVVFIKYCGFKIVFPGDLEKAGWRNLLQLPAFVSELSGTAILVASHHGRESGFCSDIFQHFTPLAVVISDKEIQHETQETVPDYRNVVAEDGVLVRTTGKRRHVLTTRRDGWIQFTADERQFFVDTQHNG